MYICILHDHWDLLWTASEYWKAQMNDKFFHSFPSYPSFHTHKKIPKVRFFFLQFFLNVQKSCTCSNTCPLLTHTHNKNILISCCYANAFLHYYFLCMCIWKKFHQHNVAIHPNLSAYQFMVYQQRKRRKKTKEYLSCLDFKKIFFHTYFLKKFVDVT